MIQRGGGGWQNVVIQNSTILTNVANKKKKKIQKVKNYRQYKEKQREKEINI